MTTCFGQVRRKRWPIKAHGGRLWAIPNKDRREGFTKNGEGFMGKKAVLLIAAVLLLTTGFQQPKGKRAQPERTGSAAVARVAASQSSGWIAFAPKDGGFSVMLPGKPIEKSLQAATAAGPITVPAYQLASGEFGYMITYRDYPNTPEEVQARDKLLQMAAEKAVTVAGGKVFSSEAISLGDYPGREVKAEIPGSILQTRSYFVKPRLYILMIFMPPDKTASENVSKFFDSFKVLPDKQGSAGSQS